MGLTTLNAQNNWTFSLSVITKDLETKKQISGAQLIIIDKNTNARVHSALSSAEQQIKLNLEPGKDYILRISKDGYVNKNISVSTKNVPYNDKSTPSYIFEVTTDIFTEEPDEDYSAFRPAFGMILYNQTKKDFVWMPNEDAKKKEEELKNRRKEKRSNEEKNEKKDLKETGKKELAKVNANKSESIKKAIDNDERRRKMEEYRKFLKEESMSSLKVDYNEPKLIYVNLIQTETIEHRNHIVTETKVTFDAGKKVVYRKIVFEWGGTYYTQDEHDLTDVTYDLLMRIIVPKQ
jgi:hypothetical protein